MTEEPIETLTPPSLCVECRSEVDRAVGDGTPEPGDFSICVYCSALNVFADDLTLRSPTLDEFSEANQNEMVTLMRSRIIELQQARRS